MLALERKEANVQAGVEKTLKGYLFGAVQYIGNTPKAIAAGLAQEYAEGSDLSSFTNNPKETVKAIADKEKELKAAAKQYGLQEKMNYAFDTKPVEADAVDSVARPMFTAIATGLAVSTMAVAGSAEGAVAMGAMGLFVGVTMSTGRFLSRAENKEEARKIDEYAAIKHTQLALKKLKKQLAPALAEKEDKTWVPSAREMLAAGLGNPGGVITPLTFRKDKGR